MADTVARHFDSVNALLDYARSGDTGFAPGDERARNLTDVTDSSGPPSFVGVSPGTTWNILRERFAKGRNEDVQRLRKEIGAIDVPVVKNVRRRGAWAEQGDELNRDRLWAGYTDAWRTARRQASAGFTHIRIVASIGGSAHVNHKNLFYTGAAAAALADALVAAGYEVEVIASSAARNVPESCAFDVQTSVTAKGFQEPLALPPLVATCASGPFFRTAVLAAHVRQCAERQEKTRSGLGQYSPTDIALLPFAGSNVRTVILPSVYSAKDANEAVRAAVRDLEEMPHDAASPAPPAPAPIPPRPPAPMPPTRPAPLPPGTVRKGDTVTWKGAQYRVSYAGPTRYGMKAKLESLGAGGSHWVKLAELTAGRQ